MAKTSIICFILCAFVCASYVGGDVLTGRGWNDNIKWVTFQDGLNLSKQQNKPLMLVIHKTWCGACKALKPRFASSKEIQTLSSHFIMVNTMDEEEPEDVKYAPDGGYIPRVLFLDHFGNVLPVMNENSKRYRYYYNAAEDVVQSMKRTMKLLENTIREPSDL